MALQDGSFHDWGIKAVRACLVLEICAAMWVILKQIHFNQNFLSGNTTRLHSSCQSMLTHANLPVSRLVRPAGDDERLESSCLLHAFVNQSDFENCFSNKNFKGSSEPPAVIYMEGDSRMRGFFDCFVAKVAGEHFRSKTS